MKLLKHLKLILLSCLFLMTSVLGTIALSGGGAEAATLAQACTWKVVASPNGTYSYLNGVAGVAANDAWAVGSQIQHWDGKQWKLVSPNLGSTQNLYAVATISSTDAWAVGNDFSSDLPLAEQWNGSQWNVVAIPNPSNSGGTILKGIAAVSANDIWAAGSYFSNSSNTNLTLIEHYDGTKWSIVSSPNPGIDNNALSAISAVSANDVWAVGTYGNIPKTGSLNYKTLVEHYDGTQWSVVASPNPANGENIELYGVSAAAANNVWAVGTYLDHKSGGYKGLIEDWNGTAWKISAQPVAPELSGVVAISAKSVWAVGGTFKNSVEHTLTEHWNATKWSIVASPNPSGSSGSVLSSVTHIPGSNQLWAVGTFQSKKNGANETLTEVYC